MAEQVGKKVLVVEDELIIATDISLVLKEAGFSVTAIAKTRDEALASVDRERPDVVLMDIQLAGPADGIETANALRTHAELPVVFLTANTDARTVDRALETTAYGYVAKPFNRATLLATLNLALRRSERDRSRQSTEAAESARLVQANAELTQLADRLREESTVDALTGLYNRRHLDQVLTRELSLAVRAGHGVGVILLDLDHFKALNDTFGHVAADAVLRGVADYLRSRLRVYDIPCRYGGEEIVIVVPGARTRDAATLAEQLRQGIERLAVQHAGRAVTPITASFGVSTFPRHGVDGTQLLQAADGALYVSKSDGRNRVSVAPMC
jgi:diguanylate cyclase (GGDEF)-like protein